MAYHVYHTQAFILGGRPFGEGDRLLYCYTRELGLVVAHAKSLREGRSRLRYGLQQFAHAEIDIIRGKHGWKLISARPVNSLRSVWGEGTKRRILANYVQLISRLIVGEEQNAALFDDILNGVEMLAEIEDEDDLHMLELLFVVRLLAQLGYWGEEETHALLLDEDAWSPLSLLYIETHRQEILSNVNRALRESQL